MDENLLINGSKYLFVLYLVISGNYLGNLFGCKVQDIMNNNFIVKNLLGFLTFYFFVALVDTSNIYSMKKKLIISALIYIIFMMSTKTHYKFWYVFIISIGLSYILQLVKDDTNKDEEKKTEKYNEKIKTVQLYLVIIASISLILGFTYYLGEKKIEYGEDFEFSKFILGNPKCKGNILTYDQGFFDVLKTAFK